MTDEIRNSLDLTLSSSAIEEAADEIKVIGGDLMEVGLDALLNDGLLRDIPIIGMLISAGKAAGSISNFLLTKKIIRFIFQLKDTTLEERKKFLDELGSNRKNDILENLMLILDKHDNYQKSEIQGKLLSSYIKGKISVYDYDKLTYAVSMLDGNFLFLLKSFYLSEDNRLLTPEQIYNFIFLQLVKIDNSKIGLWGGGGPEYKKNRLGLILVEISTNSKLPDEVRKDILGHSDEGY